MTNDQSDKTFHPNRRGFLGVAAATGAASLAPGVLIGTAATTAALAETSEPAPSQSMDASASPIAAKLPPPVPGYLSFGPDEAGFAEVMVNVMCPADALTPGGVDCGLAAYIDRQLAGGFGKGARLYMRGPWREGKPELGYQLPLTPEQFFKAGLAAADAACRKRKGKAFSELDESGADRFLHEIADGKVTDERVQLASWFNELVYPLFEQACFADPIYGGNVGKVFWKAIGYPGGGYIYANVTNGRPIASRAVPPSTPKWGAEWKKANADWCAHNFSITAHGSWYPHRENYVDLDPTYVDAYGQPLLRMTFDVRENERKMSVYLSKKIDEIAKATGADIAPPTAPRKGPYDSRVYQTTHVTGGTIMGSDPGTSVVSPHLQHWDAENLFVVGASVYPFNAGYNPTGPLGALALRLGDDLNDYVARPHHL